MNKVKVPHLIHFSVSSCPPQGRIIKHISNNIHRGKTMKSCISALLIILIVSVLVSNCVTTPVEGPDKKKEAELLISQGLDQYLLGRYNESISLSERALALDPSSVQAWTNKAYAEIAT
jgi:hypothetical protein